jgi:hypothetical protein
MLSMALSTPEEYLYIGGPGDPKAVDRGDFPTSQSNPYKSKSEAIASLQGEDCDPSIYLPSHYLDIAIARQMPMTMQKTQTLKMKRREQIRESESKYDASAEHGFDFSNDDHARYMRRYERVMTQPSMYLDIAVEPLKAKVRKDYFDVLRDEIATAMKR